MTKQEAMDTKILKIWDNWKPCIEDLGLDATVLNAMAEYANCKIMEKPDLRKLQSKDGKLPIPDVSGSFSLNFIKWYSGMEGQKILNAFERYKRESGNDR